MSKELEKATINYAQKVGSGLNYDVVKLSFRAGALWQKKQPITFNCIGKQVTMTIQQLIDYYIDRECADVADECGF